MRIVSLAPSNTEILYKLDAEDQIVATTSLCDYPEEATEKPSVGGWINPDIERIVELNPDLVLASDDLQDQVVEKLEAEKLDFLQVKPHSLEEVFESIETIGEAVGKKKAAEEVAKEMKAEIESVDLGGRRIYCEEWMEPPMVSGNWIPDLIKKGEGKYFIEEGRSREFDTGELKDFDPEYIFLNVCGSGENVDQEEVFNRENWQEIQAVKEDNVYVIDDGLLNRSGPRLGEGLKRIEQIIISE